MIDVHKLKSENDIVDVVGRYLHLDKDGSEYVGMCPFHEDTKPSLKVNEKKQIFGCFACGENGDVIDFVSKVENVSFREACKIINSDEGRYDVKVVPKRIEKKKDEWIPSPLDTSANVEGFIGLSNVSHPKFGKPSGWWVYRSEYSLIVGAVLRFDLDDGSKQVLPYCYAKKEGMTKAVPRFMRFAKPGPLYNLHFIHQFKDAKIIVVEGEKTADAVQEMFNPTQLIATTWIGGANGIKNADFSPLKGRDCIYWPDHDKGQTYGKNHERAGELKPWYEQPGNKAMLDIINIVGNDPELTRWIHVPSEYPDKWDAADKDWTRDGIIGFIKDKIGPAPKVPADAN